MIAEASQASLNPIDAGLIYCVDDDDGDRALFRRALEGAGLHCECRSFHAGEELLDALIGVMRGAPAPIACFVDIKMAGMSGLDVLRWIRAQRALDSIPVVMLSSSDDPQFLSEAHHFGAQCYVTKFPPAEHLAEIITEARRYAAAAMGNTAFALPCNLLLASHPA